MSDKRKDPVQQVLDEVARASSCEMCSLYHHREAQQRLTIQGLEAMIICRGIKHEDEIHLKDRQVNWLCVIVVVLACLALYCEWRG